MSGLEHDVVLLDVLDPAFRPDSEQVAQARAAGWYARTTVGFAVLRYQQAAEVLADRRFVLPGAASLIARGVSSGPMFDWWTSIIVNVDGAAHARLRRLVGKAFTRRAVDALRGVMRAVAEELVDAFAATGECEFMADFADPYPVRITDPAVFGQTTFDITATRPAPQLTFGGGSSHHCLGAFLARTELAEALPILARGLRDPRLAGTPQWRPPVGVTGPVTLPLRFTPTRQPIET